MPPNSVSIHLIVRADRLVRPPRNKRTIRAHSLARRAKALLTAPRVAAAAVSANLFMKFPVRERNVAGVGNFAVRV